MHDPIFSLAAYAAVEWTGLLEGRWEVAAADYTKLVAARDAGDQTVTYDEIVAAFERCRAASEDERLYWRDVIPSLLD